VEQSFTNYAEDWKKIYSEDFTADEKKKIISSLKQAVGASGFKVERPGASKLKTAEVRLRTPHWGQQAHPSKKRKNGILIHQAKEDQGAP